MDPATLPFPTLRARFALICGQMLVYHERFDPTAAQLELYYAAVHAASDALARGYRRHVLAEFVTAAKAAQHAGGGGDDGSAAPAIDGLAGADSSSAKERAGASAVQSEALLADAACHVAARGGGAAQAKRGREPVSIYDSAAVTARKHAAAGAEAATGQAGRSSAAFEGADAGPQAASNDDESDDSDDADDDGSAEDGDLMDAVRFHVRRRVRPAASHQVNTSKRASDSEHTTLQTAKGRHRAPSDTNAPCLCTLQTLHPVTHRSCFVWSFQSSTRALQ